MNQPIRPEAFQLPEPIAPEPVRRSERSEGFRGALDALREVNRRQAEAGELARRYAEGEDVDVHEVMIAAEEARLAMGVTLQLRNRALEAVQELMRMQV